MRRFGVVERDHWRFGRPLAWSARPDSSLQYRESASASDRWTVPEAAAA